MIGKDSIINHLFEWGLILQTTAVVTVLQGYDPSQAIVGSVGQLFAIGARYVWVERTGKKQDVRTIKYWVFSILLGAISAFVFSKYVAQFLNIDVLLSGFLCGVVAQFAYDFIMALKVKF